MFDEATGKGKCLNCLTPRTDLPERKPEPEPAPKPVEPPAPEQKPEEPTTSE